MTTINSKVEGAVSCEVIQDLLPLYHDEVCSAQSCSLIESHLKGCTACSNILSAMNDTKMEEALALETQDVLKKHAKRERSLAYKTGIVFACILILPVVIAVLMTLPGYSDWRTNAVLIASMLLVAGLTVVPLVSTKKKLSKSIIFSTAALLLIIFFTEMFFYDSGLLFFAETAFSVIFGLSLPLFPVLVCHADLPDTISRHKGLLCMIWDTIWLYLMLFVFCIAYPDSVHDLLIAPGFYLILAWLLFLEIRYVPSNALTKTGIAIILCGIFLAIGNAWGWVEVVSPRDVHMQILGISLPAGGALSVIGAVAGLIRKRGRI